jgi:hypothetical protein
MVRQEAVSIMARPVGTSPIMRRDTNNLIITFDQAEALSLIQEISSAFGDGFADKIYMHIEFDNGMFYPKEVTSDGEAV